MLWLASYPRSGNTFLRNVLVEVYGIESSTFHRETAYPLDPDYTSRPIVKTHLLPSELEPADPNIPAVYLVRDGRDCLVSLAHYRQQLLDPDSEYHLNLCEAVEAAQGSHFGGWGEHVRQWTRRASLVLRFEELIADPIACVERLRPWVNLPPPRRERLPTFEDLRTRDFRYGSGVEHDFSRDERESWRRGKFRRGKVGAWRDELPRYVQTAFMERHGTELAGLGYVPAGSAATAGGRAAPAAPRRPGRRVADKKRVLINATKLLDGRVDGIKRYVHELLRALIPLAAEHEAGWEFDVSLGPAGVFPLLEIAYELQLGRLPEEQMPPLLRTDLMNPINAAKLRLAELKPQGWWHAFPEWARLHGLRAARGVVKRQHQLARALDPYRIAYDLVHLTLPNTWESCRRYRAPLLTTVHDLSHLVCPQFQSTSNADSLAKGLAFAERRRSSYLAVSRATSLQMSDLLGIQQDRIDVVHNASDRRKFRPLRDPRRLAEVAQRYNLAETPFILCVGTLEPRKNIANTIRAFDLLREEHPDLNARLVLAGAPGWGGSDDLQQAARDRSHVQYLGYVSDGDLPVLYSLATAFCYVSHYEGFGLPLLEAMACGAPTIYGDGSAMPEIVSDAGLPAEAGDVRSIKERMRQLLTSEDLRKELSGRGIERAKAFTWGRTAEATFASYQRVIEAASPRRRRIAQTGVAAASTRTTSSPERTHAAA